MTPPAAPGVWDSSGARLRRPDALASGRTLSFSCRGFLPWAFVVTWVSRRRSCLGSYLLLEVLSFPCPGFRWAFPAVWWSRRLLFSWNLTLGSSLSLPVFAVGLRWLVFILGCPPFVAWLWRLLPWFFVRYLLACPRGAAVPLDSLVLWCSCLHVRSPVSGQVCVLPQSTIVTLLSLLWVGLLLALVRGLCLRLTLWASACVGPPGCPAFSRVGPAPSTWVPLLWTWLMGRLPPCSFSSVFLRDVVTLFWG